MGLQVSNDEIKWSTRCHKAKVHFFPVHQSKSPFKSICYAAALGAKAIKAVTSDIKKTDCMFCIKRYKQRFGK